MATISPPATFVEHARTEFLAALGNDENEWACAPHDTALLDLYTGLVLTVGETCTMEHVHNTWAVAQQRAHRTDEYLVPYREVDPDRRADADVIRDAVRVAAERLNTASAL